jgi:AcrR family transcriptional regulator
MTLRCKVVKVSEAPIRSRTSLSRARILETAMELADRAGVHAVSMRKLGASLGVEAMSLYNHVANRDDLLDGMVDLVFGEIRPAEPGEDWRSTLRARYLSTRRVLARHRWAIALMESRANPGPATLRHHDAVLGSLRAGGFTLPQAARAYSVLDSYVYGFALTETALPFEDEGEIAEMADAMLARFPADEFPHLAEFTAQHVMQPGYDYGDEFERGLDLILDALDRLRTAQG